MSSLEPRTNSEHEIMAVRAGLNVQYPGLSEYRGKIGSDDNASKLEATKQVLNHSIRNDLIRDHYLRLNKYQNERNFSVTGNSEQRVRYVKHDANEYKKLPVTRKDFDKNTYFDNLPKNLGRSEYVERYAPTKPIAHQSEHAQYTINPKQDIVGASQGRPLAEKTEMSQKEKQTQYRDIHDWPKREKRELFEWIKS